MVRSRRQQSYSRNNHINRNLFLFWIRPFLAIVPLLLLGFTWLTCYRLNNSIFRSVAYIPPCKCVNCLIGVIQPNSFIFGDNETISFGCIRMKVCGITEVKPTGFAGSENAHELYLQNNKIKVLHEGNATNTFSGVYNLRGLYLDKNRITSIETNDFKGLEEPIALYLN